MPVTFHKEDTEFNLSQKLKHKRWIKAWIESRNHVCGNLAFVITSNVKLRSINQEYLNHKHFTDVITFDYTEGKKLAGDIFISIDQVKMNADSYGTYLEDELRRVMIHGVLHLQGYSDSTKEEKERMRQLENEALLLWMKMVENGISI